MGKVLKEQYESKRYIAAICAAPCALKAHGIARGAEVTSHPLVKGDLESKTLLPYAAQISPTLDYYKYCEKDIVEDGHLLTSRGPGTAAAFGLKLAEILTNHETVKSVASGMLLPF